MTDLYCKQNAPINQPEVGIHIGVGSLKQSNTGHSKEIIILIQQFSSVLIKPSKFSKNNIKVWSVKEKGKEIKETWLTGRSGKLESAEADIIESFIVKDHTFISILNIFNQHHTWLIDVNLYMKRVAEIVGTRVPWFSMFSATIMQVWDTCNVWFVWLR